MFILSDQTQVFILDESNHENEKDKCDVFNQDHKDLRRPVSIQLQVTQNKCRSIENGVVVFIREFINPVVQKTQKNHVEK